MAIYHAQHMTAESIAACLLLSTTSCARGCLVDEQMQFQLYICTYMHRYWESKNEDQLLRAGNFQFTVLLRTLETKRRILLAH
jgi:hypothetical protein